jgi:hypothetical protein
MALTSSITIGVVATLTNAGDLVTATAPLTYRNTWSLTDGAGANQAQQIFCDTRTLAASANEDIDLAGVLTNAFGTTLTFTKVKAIIIKAADANTNSVVVSRPASNGVPIFDNASDSITLPPDGCLALVIPSAAGKTVTASTGDLLNIANSAGSTSVTYDIIIIGATS